ncbi:MAG: hypothetical protein KGI25_06545 [Thaumarchaeota archaeon]|nr:hypothetical protein [Nitrososphaerota archaeon]
MKRNQYDITFLELEMPEMIGYYIIRELEKTGNMNNQNIVISTTSEYISDQQIEELKNKGVKSIFKKPLETGFSA